MDEPQARNWPRFILIPARGTKTDCLPHREIPQLLCVYLGTRYFLDHRQPTCRYNRQGEDGEVVSKVYKQLDNSDQAHMPINKITSESTPPRPLISHKPNPPVRVRLYPPNVSPLPSSVRSSDRPVSALQPPAFSFLLILPPKRPAQNPDLRKKGRRPHGVCRAGVPDASTLISRIQASLGHDDDAVIISFPFFHYGKSSYSTRGAKSPPSLS